MFKEGGQIVLTTELAVNVWVGWILLYFIILFIFCLCRVYIQLFFPPEKLGVNMLASCSASADIHTIYASDCMAAVAIWSTLQKKMLLCYIASGRWTASHRCVHGLRALFMSACVWKRLVINERCCSLGLTFVSSLVIKYICICAKFYWNAFFWFHVHECTRRASCIFKKYTLYCLLRAFWKISRMMCWKACAFFAVHLMLITWNCCVKGVMLLRNVRCMQGCSLSLGLPQSFLSRPKVKKM